MHPDNSSLEPDAPEPTAVAEAVRRACLDAALAAWEDAGIQGLCGEGRWEIAVSAVRRLDLHPVVEQARSRPTEQTTACSPERD